MNRHRIIWGFCLMTSLMVISCNYAFKQAESDNQPVIEEDIFRIKPTQRDSADIKALVDSFMGHVIRKDYYKAAGMLYKAEAKKLTKEPDLLDNEELAAMVKLLGGYPVYDYSIEHIKIYRAEINEVKCSIELTPKTSDNPNPMRVNWYFKPIRYIGKWVLCMKDSANGDESLN